MEKNFSFLDAWEKMRDYVILSKDEFLFSYSYLTEENYDATTKEVEALPLRDWANFANLVRIYDSVDEENPIYEKCMNTLQEACSRLKGETNG